MCWLVMTLLTEELAVLAIGSNTNPCSLLLRMLEARNCTYIEGLSIDPICTTTYLLSIDMWV